MVQILVLSDVQHHYQIDVDELGFVVIPRINPLLVNDLLDLDDPILRRPVPIRIKIAEHRCRLPLLHVELDERLRALRVRLEVPLLLREDAVGVEEEFLQVQIRQRRCIVVLFAVEGVPMLLLELLLVVVVTICLHWIPLVLMIVLLQKSDQLRVNFGPRPPGAVIFQGVEEVDEALLDILATESVLALGEEAGGLEFGQLGHED